MTAIECLESFRDKYVEHYRSILRSRREAGTECMAEVWVDPPAPPGEERPPHPLCIDILANGKDGAELLMVSDEPADGSLVATMNVRDIPVRLFEARWENFPLWVRIKEPNWAALDPWKQRWMNANPPERDEDGLTGSVHHLGRPTAEGGGYFYLMDLGSAPVEAVTGLLDVLAEMGASEIELGRSDGSDLPPRVLEILKHPDLYAEDLGEAAVVCLTGLPEIEQVERTAAEQIVIRVKGNPHPHQVFLGNLHRLLLRTSSEARPKEFSRFLRGQRESMGPQEPPDLSQLRVLVKDDRFIAHFRQLGPKIKPMVMEKLCADLWLACVWDAPNGMRFTTAGEGEPYGLSDQELLQRAKENYLKNRAPVELAEHGPLLVAQTRDCYDATLLIDSKWCSEMSAKVSGEMIACVPARNLVLIGGLRNAGTVDEMCQAARRIEAGGDHLISDTILLWRDGKWEAFAAPSKVSPKPDILPPQPSPPPPSKNRPWWKVW